MRVWCLGVLAVAACGGRSPEVPPDASSPGGSDAGTDAPAADAPATDAPSTEPPPAPTVTITDTDANQPLTAVTFDADDDLTIELANRGSATTAPIAIAITGAVRDDIAIDPSSTCTGQALAPDARCILVLRYLPQTDALRTGALTLTVAPGAPTAIPITPLARPTLRIVFAGDAQGDVVIDNELTGTRYAACTTTCRVRVPAGEDVVVIPSTPSVFGGLTGACTSARGGCRLTTTTALKSVTATFTRAPGELYTRLLGTAKIMSAAFDTAGNLVVAADKITKLSPVGATVWQVALDVCSVAIGPDDTIYAQTQTQLHKLSAAGAPVWTVPLDPRAVGCARDGDGFDGFLHNLAVGSDGAVAVHGDTGVARWTASGAFSWSAALTSGGRYGVVIDAAGVVGAAIESLNLETTDLARFSATGTRLADEERVAVQYHGMMVLAPSGRLLATSSGHSHVDALGKSVDLEDPDFVPNGICAAGSGAGWLYEPDDNSQLARVWTLERFNAADQQVSTFTSVPAQGPPFDDLLGTAPHDIAGAPSGRIAVVGAYVTTDRLQGFITVFAP